MAGVELISNEGGGVGERVRALVAWGDRVDIAVAYLKMSGYEEIREALAGKDVRILAGVDFCLTEAKALKAVRGDGHCLRIYQSPEGNYHPKVYIARKGGETRALVGSSNLSEGALCRNVEANVWLSAGAGDAVLADVAALFERLWDSDAASERDSDWIEEYGARQQEADGKRRAIRPAPTYAPPVATGGITAENVIFSMSRPHDAGRIYDRLVGVPAGARSPAERSVRAGTKIFVYYLGEGIGTIVRATSSPYFDDAIVEEWRDGEPERYPIRVRTEPVLRFDVTVPLGRLRELGVTREDTGAPIMGFHIMSSVMPISPEDARRIEEELARRDEGAA